jgi:hypothetical protein
MGMGALDASMVVGWWLSDSLFMMHAPKVRASPEAAVFGIRIHKRVGAVALAPVLT